MKLAGTRLPSFVLIASQSSASQSNRQNETICSLELARWIRKDCQSMLLLLLLLPVVDDQPACVLMILVNKS